MPRGTKFDRVRCGAGVCPWVGSSRGHARASHGPSAAPEIAAGLDVGQFLAAANPEPIARVGYGVPHTRMQVSSELERVPEGPGIYVFGRGYGENVAPIYIGETLRLRQRIEQHLKYVPLMKALDNAKNGSRVLLIGELERRRGVQAKRILPRIEHSLIKYALAQGYELVNKKGTRTPYDTIEFLGNRKCKRLFGSHMNIERNKRG